MGSMRIKIVQKPRIADMDGIRLDLFEVGFQYEVGNNVGALLLAEGWAVPVPLDEPGVVIPLTDSGSSPDPSNLIRTFRSKPHGLRLPNAADKPPKK